ncbi:peptidoglycan editing factor PgeF [Muribaculaceae bacterium Isolate-004 (NCI)]|nr:peptidoglycan editing factor PgeF [Muribaculaceae bacterium Isolate-004 (NCI)]
MGHPLGLRRRSLTTRRRRIPHHTTTMTPLPHITLNAGPNATALSTLRGATRPNDPYDGLNCCHYTGDTPQHIQTSRTLLARHLHIPLQQLIIPHQTHSANVATITDPDNIPPLTDTDALVTNLPRTPLLIHTADCVPIILHDPHTHTIAAIHAGWRGAIADITTHTIHTMTTLGAHPSHIIAAMGPAICPRCFETSPQIAAQFPPHLITYPQHPSGSPATPRPHADIPALIRLQLIKAGIPPHHISMPPLCTHCNPHILFSARHHTINSGRITTLILTHP